MKTQHKVYLLLALIVLLLLVLFLQAHTPTGRAISAEAHSGLIDSNPLRAPPRNPSPNTPMSTPVS
ncbi:MAG: hypothetical protein AABX70_07575 [Nanoarchaeota archaeon]